MVLLAVPSIMSSLGKIIEAMRSNPRGVAYNDLYRVCEHYFGKPRQGGTSHAVFAMPWAGDPRVNIQNDKGKAKAYQVRQVLKAIDKKEAM
ncbi:toxin HicA [Phytohabitans aurantiacus]|nr:toxin HicA [Phytohabitans aurantiacus]